ncbi:MAG: peptidase M16 [Deltaproteobacteria bacterium HGW-Deltaproteobacteria-15]|jgi:predicted Zn-dependent peptidase|nr:MAG: peptidase M16 [Deltaproteobacteria bacterium HGW-Deltaproteobacteria-15]
MHKKTVLPNGVRILTERLDHFRSVSFGIWIGVGSRDETVEENGISHFVEHMIFKGTRSRNSHQIAIELDAIGGLSNAFTSSEYTCFHSRVLDKHMATLVDILSDIFLRSTFDPTELDRERQVILQEISMLEDTPDEHIHVLFSNLHWMNHPLGMSVLGTPDSVSSIGREDILSHMRKFYTPEQILLVAAGNVDHQILVDQLRPLFEQIQPSDKVPARTSPNYHAGTSCFHKDLEQVHVCLGGLGPTLSSQQRFAGAVLNIILGGNMSSRLFQEIREKRGIAYSIFSFLASYIDAGLLGVYLATEPKNVNRSLEIIRKEIGRIQKGDISESELAATKEHIIGGILLGSESTDSKMMRLAKNEYVYGRYISHDEVISVIEKVRLEEVVDVARESFRNDRVSLVTLGPFQREELDESTILYS